MKCAVKWFISFGAGVLVASVCWGWYVMHLQMDLAVGCATTLVREAELGRMMLEYLESPDPSKARRVEFAASNTVVHLSADVESLDRQFPWMRLNSRLSPSTERAESFIRDWQSKAPVHTDARVVEP